MSRSISMLAPARVRAAFTLIELLVVIAIIALLVTILVPSLSEAKGLAMIATCSSQLHGLGIAAAQYSSSYEMDRPWLFANGTGDGSREDPLSDGAAPWNKQPGNPALALCHPDGPEAYEWFIDDARPLFCFASYYNYDDNYAAYPSLAMGSDWVWGTYRYTFKWIPRSEDPWHNVIHQNRITVDVPDEASDVMMTDWQTDFHSYSHYNLLRLNGVVDFLGRRDSDLDSYMWG